jgi:type II secretory pathway predicted ATPase ExeA
MDDTMNATQSSLKFFGLKEQPFAATADPAYFYATRGHKECLFRLWSSVDERHGIAVVLGHYGTGKTTLLRKLLSGMAAEPDRYNTAVVASPIPSWTSFSLLEAIVTQFGLRPAERSFAVYMEALNRYLLDNRNRINTLIIDDSQNLNKRGQLELLRLVQNLETAQHKLLNLVLLAQREWLPILRAAPNFAQRINMSYALTALSFEETRSLIDFRLRQAGAGIHAPVFDEAAIRVMHAYSEGSPRVIVTLARNAMLVASQVGSRQIGQDIAMHTIKKSTLPDEEREERVLAAMAVAPEPPRLEEAMELPIAPVPLRPAGDARKQTAQDSRANRMLMNAPRNQPDTDMAVGYDDRFHG